MSSSPSSLLALIMSFVIGVSLLSCKEEAPIQTKGKIKSITYNNINFNLSMPRSVYSYQNFEYDDNGKLTKCLTKINEVEYCFTYTRKGTYLVKKTYKDNFSSSTDSISINSYDNAVSDKCYCFYSSTNPTEYTSSGSLILAQTYLFEYSKDKFISNINLTNSQLDGLQRIVSFYSDNTNFLKYIDQYNDTVYCEYSSKLQNNGKDQVISRTNNGLWFYIPGHCGQLSHNLLKYQIKAFSHSTRRDTTNYDYVFDNRGRVKTERLYFQGKLENENEYTYY